MAHRAGRDGSSGWRSVEGTFPPPSSRERSTRGTFPRPSLARGRPRERSPPPISHGRSPLGTFPHRPLAGARPGKRSPADLSRELGPGSALPAHLSWKIDSRNASPTHLSREVAPGNVPPTDLSRKVGRHRPPPRRACRATPHLPGRSLRGSRRPAPALDDHPSLASTMPLVVGPHTGQQSRYDALPRPALSHPLGPVGAVRRGNSPVQRTALPLAGFRSRLMAHRPSQQ